MLKVKIDLKKMKRDVSTLEKVNRAAAQESLRETGRFAKREGAKLIKETNYSTMPRKEILSSIAVRGSKETDAVPIDQLFSSVGFFGRSVPVRYMRARNSTVRTRLGRRWGVIVKGLGWLPGVFHLKRSGKWYSGREAAFDKRSQLFYRDGSDKLQRYRFKTMTEILNDAGALNTLVSVSIAYLSKQMGRNTERYRRQFRIGT